MTEPRAPLWTRILLGLLTLAILAFTVPAYFNPASNPGLAALSEEYLSLGSIAGVFLGRQLAIALIAAYGVIKGNVTPMMIGAFGIAFFNLHDAALLTVFGSGGTGAIAGAVFGVAALVAMWFARRTGVAPT